MRIRRKYQKTSHLPADQTVKMRKIRKIPLRAKMTALMVVYRLSWGAFVSPLYWKNHVVKFFPPPKKSVYKQILANYFFRN
jgi:hypothetical protein